MTSSGVLPIRGSRPWAGSMLVRRPSRAHAGLGTQHPIELGREGGELPGQRLIPRDGVAPDLLIGVAGHAAEVADMGLQSRLAVAHRLAEQLARDGLDLGK